MKTAKIVKNLPFALQLKNSSQGPKLRYLLQLQYAKSLRHLVIVLLILVLWR